MMNSSDNVFSFFESFTNLERKMSFSEREYRLDRMKYLLELFKNPHNSFKVIHVAGSKGKGSTAAITASILKSLGYKTGLYTSPHLMTYKERITIAGEFIDEKVLTETGNNLRQKLENTELPFPDPPTTFELLTLFAFILFRETDCQWAVIETGIGGRLDATNLVSPAASVITPIEIEHSDILGDTIEKIAREKGGIIKKGIPVFTAVQNKEVLSVLKSIASENSSPFFKEGETIRLENIKIKADGTDFDLVQGTERIRKTINLIGEFQAKNYALSVLVLSTLLKMNFSEIAVSADYIPLKGRIEIVRKADFPDIIIDSSHTPVSALMLSISLKEIYKGKGILIFGSVDGKDYCGMMKNLSDCFDHIVISKPGLFKRSSPDDIFSDLKKIYPEKHIILEKEAEKAFNKALVFSEGEKHIVVTGSFYMASEIIKLF